MMRYRELVTYEPLETIIQLREVSDKQKARHLVETYVVSERMAEKLAEVVIPHLRLDRPTDNKGIMVVGNYGTGKSHLMSVLSAVAEHADLVGDLKNERVRRALEPVAGTFKVVRTELGGGTRPLRDSVLEQLELFLEEVGTPYPFPRADQVTNNKDALIAAVDGFRQRYPGQGILFVLDELLDYLRSRDERALILDLGFLRELGEVTELTAFRFISGVQESLFDSPRFAFVADQLRRVRDRFEQVRIAREDIAFVVAERLLKKTDWQLARITDHLRRFTPLYPLLADNLDSYARLFPIHPAYIETFEQVYIAEQREVLKTFETAIRGVLEQEVPTDQTGLISFDHYWGMIKENPSLCTLPGVVDVVEKSDVLTGRVESAYTRRNLLPLAQRIIQALSVHRLTTSDINTPLGMTVEELRDKLCLWTMLPEADAQFLASTIQVALREIMRTVSSQYISLNQDNGQYYLDLKKTIDLDANIARRGEFLNKDDLNRYFFEVLRQIFTELPASTHVPGYRIWPYELPWLPKNVTRPGYLFFGLPNERSTAQPPRDFYIYILPPFVEPGLTFIDFRNDGIEPDNLIYHLTSIDSEMEGLVRSYGGAKAMAQQSPVHAYDYEGKADGYASKLTRWLKENSASRMRVTYRGVTHTFPEVLAATRSSASQGIQDVLKLIAAHLLEPNFSDKYPDYPTFTNLNAPISEKARATDAMYAIHFIATRQRRTMAINILHGLQLLDSDERIKPLNSPYANHLLQLLLAKSETQVVNHSEVLIQVAGGLDPIYKEPRFWLEPEWVAVLLVALIYDGQIVLNLGGADELDAAAVERASTRAIEDLCDFRFYKRPRGLPLALWQQIFDGLGLQSSLVREESTRDQAVRDLLQLVQGEVREVVTLQDSVQRGFTLWNSPLFTDRLELRTQSGAVVSHSPLAAVSLSTTDLLPALRATKDFLEKLSRYDRAGKLRNLAINGVEIQEALTYRKAVQRIKGVVEAVAQLQSITGYLSEGSANLPPEHDWVQEAQKRKEQLLNELRAMAKGDATPSGTGAIADWQRILEQLKQRYSTHYVAYHQQLVLGPEGIDTIAQLKRSLPYTHLRQLAQIDILNANELTAWEGAINAIPTCAEFHAGLLVNTPTCPHCRLRAIGAGTQPAAERLAVLRNRLQTLADQWHGGLRAALASDTARQSMAAMTSRERKPLDDYLALAEPAQSTLPTGLVPAANQVLRGLQTERLVVTDLLAALKHGGLPCTVHELESRFRRYIQQQMRGHDEVNTRLMIEES
jgi:hypothetical protein